MFILGAELPPNVLKAAEETWFEEKAWKPSAERGEVRWGEVRRGEVNWVWRVTHHGGKAGYEFHAVLHLLLGDLHRRAVLLLQRKRIGAVLRHPGMEL